MEHVWQLKRKWDIGTLRSDLLMVVRYEKAVNTDCPKPQELTSIRADLLPLWTQWKLLLPLLLQNLFIFMTHPRHFLALGSAADWLPWCVDQEALFLYVNVWQKPLQYCKVISLQLIKINGKKIKKKKKHCSWDFTGTLSRIGVIRTRTCLVAPWLRLCLPVQGVQVWFQVRELRSYMQQGVAKKVKKKKKGTRVPSLGRIVAFEVQLGLNFDTATLGSVPLGKLLNVPEHQFSLQ